MTAAQVQGLVVGLALLGGGIFLLARSVRAPAAPDRPGSLTPLQLRLFGVLLAVMGATSVVVSAVERGR